VAKKALHDVLGNTFVDESCPVRMAPAVRAHPDRTDRRVVQADRPLPTGKAASQGCVFERCSPADCHNLAIYERARAP
jgi:hypothetical protein